MGLLYIHSAVEEVWFLEIDTHIKISTPLLILILKSNEIGLKEVEVPEWMKIEEGRVRGAATGVSTCACKGRPVKREQWCVDGLVDK